MSEMRQLLMDTAVRLFEAASMDEVFEAVEEGRLPLSHWRAIEENGLVDMLLPEEAGGAAVGFGDAMAVALAAHLDPVVGQAHEACTAHGCQQHDARPRDDRLRSQVADDVSHDGSGDDRNAAHGRRARFGDVTSGAVEADRLADASRLQPRNEVASSHERNEHR